MALTREVRVKPGFAHIYPDVRPGAWLPAAAIAQQVTERLVATRGHTAIHHGRVLPDTHFEFRGGASQGLRPAGLLSRLADRRR